jgi:hypothetical protein
LYYADDQYIYIPIFKNKEIAAFIARLYINDNKLARYKNIQLNTNVSPIAFIDEIEENISSNTVYVTEGYFDAFAINDSFLNYKSVAIFSKSNTSKVISNLTSAIDTETKVVLTLDSLEKDKNILENIDILSNRLKEYFHNVYVCLLQYGDPNYIYVNKGPEELISILNTYTYSYVDYFKKRLITKNSTPTVFKEKIDNISLPFFIRNKAGLL